MRAAVDNFNTVEVEVSISVTVSKNAGLYETPVEAAVDNYVQEKLTPEQCNRMLLELEGIIQHKARKVIQDIHAPCIDIEDVAQLLRIKTWEIMDKYNGRKSKFTTFANLCLNRYCNNLLRDWNTKKWAGHTSFDQFTEVSDGEDSFEPADIYAERDPRKVWEHIEDPDLFEFLSSESQRTLRV